MSTPPLLLENSGVVPTNIPTLSAIAASDPRQVPVDLFHLSIYAHARVCEAITQKVKNTTASGSDKISEAASTTGGGVKLDTDEAISAAATVLSAVRLVPVAGQKRSRSVGVASSSSPPPTASSNVAVAFDVSGLHHLTKCATLASSGHNNAPTNHTPIPISAVDTSQNTMTKASMLSSHSSIVDRLVGDISHTFQTPHDVLNELLETERSDREKALSSSQYKDSKSALEEEKKITATLFEASFGRSLHDRCYPATLLDGNMVASILTPSLAEPIMKTHSGKVILSTTAAKYEPTMRNRPNKSQNGERENVNEDIREEGSAQVSPSSTTTKVSTPKNAAQEEEKEKRRKMLASMDPRSISTGTLSPSQFSSMCLQRRYQVREILAALL